jgi:hypothetical protein
MTWTHTLVLITACTLPGFVFLAEPPWLQLPLLSSGPGRGGPRKPPRKKEEKPKSPGKEEEPDIEKPATRAVCFSKANESEQQCRGFCSNYFGS